MAFFKKIKIESESEISEDPEEKKWFKSEGKLIVDVFETESEIIVQSAVAGIKPDDFDVSVENDVLKIKGIRNNPQKIESVQNYFIQECYWGPFSRQIILPKEVDSSRAQASIKEGVLTVIIPKLKKEKKKKIKLKEED